MPQLIFELQRALPFLPLIYALIQSTHPSSLISVYCTVRRERFLKTNKWSDFPGGAVVKNPPSNAGDAASIPGQGTTTREARAPQRRPSTAKLNK